ncbi:MotA/TolQ/ExbB proton channel family protein [Armatimonas sp.]|uniref:MotA/TolQ/ExbB proton channel family protein n=1 Tax=Armatimonas sp. TaxID=1872638 RepID=UPI00286BD111|nr:MotA/TolQ/ExbB proton channel family protein [Armatimonas sp.]
MDYFSWGIGLTKLVLVLASVASVAMIIERLWTLRSEGRDGEARARRAFVEGKKRNNGRLQDSVGRAVTLETLELQKNLPYLATIASTAPYIGLFGTVLGILDAFGKIARAGGEMNPAVISGSISEALITTAIGLGVAVPAAIAYNLLLARVNALSLRIENRAMEAADKAVANQEEPS